MSQLLGTIKERLSTFGDVAFFERRRHTFELRAGGPDDPDGSRTAAVLTAYLYAEQMRAFRQLLWPRLAALGAGWFVIGTLTSLFSRLAFGAGFLCLLAAGAAAAVAEWRAAEHFSECIRLHASIVDAQPKHLCAPR